jgi:hypothetical protein
VIHRNGKVPADGKAEDGKKTMEERRKRLQESIQKMNAEGCKWVC